MRTNWASGDKVTAADFNEISTMLARHDTTVAAGVLSLSGQTLTLTKPDGAVEAVELPSGGDGGTGLTTDDIAALDTYLA